MTVLPLLSFKILTKNHDDNGISKQYFTMIVLIQSFQLSLESIICHISQTELGTHECGKE